MAVLITGASGFLGGAVLRALRAEGQAVLATGRDAQICAARGLLSLDLGAPGAVEELTAAAAREGVTGIVHAAALSAPWGGMAAFRRCNVEATRTVLEVARRLGGVRVVHISTPSVCFRFADQRGLREEAALPPPVNAYAATKAEAEALALAAGAVVLRPRGIYGAGDRALLPRLVRAMQAGPLPLMRGGQAATDLTHVADVVAAIRAALGCDAGGIFHISGGVALPIQSVVAAVAAKVGVVPRWRALPVPLVMAAARALEWQGAVTGREPRVTRFGVGQFAYTQTLDIGRAARVLGWRPVVGFEDGLRRTFVGEA
ncbi:NAD(P)-dependent oxidoreductase [Pseudorhodobacter sp. MZDSW-24AT]|uniref:NAD-dependent epimerase/dehydratase family protein n=1 Tax=Pseudorhodobacter sp. MZDSW-24AT TaxID=2052957 RepID=UPI000C1F1317|nr:NAD(P)-dependent oxidoreductase [Pseudorhodobacter sp. MZDSW-24AT]PJF07937.1 3-beta hydroxysteroid dehydrogenase [Pseudorhodobacter sp. MZDSW-24AT]